MLGRSHGSRGHWLHGAGAPGRWRWGAASSSRLLDVLGKAGQESCQRPSDNGDIPTLGSAQGPSLEALAALALQALTPRGGQGSRLGCGRGDAEPRFISACHMPAAAVGTECSGGSQEAGGVSGPLGVRGGWDVAAREAGNFLWPSSELRLAAGTQTELAARRCQSCDFHGQFLLQDTWWGWLSRHM